MTGLERLRDLVDGMIEWSVYTIMNDDWRSRNGVNACSGGVAMKELLCEIADQIEREHLREVDDISGRDADAIAWVEAHGGVKECDRKVEASMEVGDKYTLLRMELGKMLGYDLMGQLDASDEELVEKVGKRLMPEGMEWPRYEDGKPFIPGDDGSVEFFGDGIFNVWINGDHQHLARGERIKRPAVLAADGEPLEVGQTVWHIDTGDEFHVSCFSDGTVNVSDKKGGGLQLLPSQLTHQRPALDADGVPIKVGDTVYDGNGEQLMVREVIIDSDPDDPEHTVWCGEEVSHGFRVYRIADQLTHQLQDSWERIEADVTMDATDYCDAHGIKPEYPNHRGKAKCEDLVRRCKTLCFAVDDHDPRSWELYRFIADMDYENGDRFCLKAGGDGDNGELLLAYLDEWFALAERGE